MDDKKKRFLRGGVLLNVILLMIGAVFILRRNQSDIILHDIPLYTAEGEFTEGDKNTFSTDYPEADYYFSVDTGSLKSGIYNITIDYFTPVDYDHDYYMISCNYSGDGEYYPAVYAEPHSLSSWSRTLSYRIWVNSKLDNLKLRIVCGTENDEIFNYGHDSVFYVDKIEVSRDYRQTVLFKGLKFLTVLLLLNGGLFVYWNRKRVVSWLRNNFFVVFGLACIFMVSSLGVFGKFSVGNHDIRFHYARIIGLAEGLKSGSFPVKIQPGWLWGHGYAASVCYGDILLYIPAVFLFNGCARYTCLQSLYSDL